MSVTSISAYSGGFNFYSNPYAGSSSGTRSVTQLASGATVTTLRGPAGDVESVTTATAATSAAAAQVTPEPGVAQTTVDVTA